MDGASSVINEQFVSESYVNPSKRVKHSITYLIPLNLQYNTPCYQLNDLELYLKYLHALTANRCKYNESVDNLADIIESSEKFTKQFLQENKLTKTVEYSDMYICDISNRNHLLATHAGKLPLCNLEDLRTVHKLLPKSLENSVLYLRVTLYAILKNTNQALYELAVSVDEPSDDFPYLHCDEFLLKYDDKSSKSGNSSIKEDVNITNLHKLAMPVLEHNSTSGSYYTRVKKTSDCYYCTAYLWLEQKKTDHLDLGEPDLVFYTFHEYAYIGFFKPTLDEVYKSLPKIPDGPFYVTTQPLSHSPNRIAIGNYQIGISKIWYVNKY